MTSDICALDGSKWPKEDKQWYQHIWDAKDSNIISLDEVDSDDSILKIVETSTKWNLFALIDESRKRLKFIWKDTPIKKEEKQDEKEEKKQKLLLELKFENDSAQHDWVIIRNVKNELNNYKKTTDEEKMESFVLDVITCDGSSKTNILARIVWREDGEKLDEEILRNGPKTVLGELVTYGTGVLINPDCEFILVGGRGGKISITTDNDSVTHVEKKRTWHVAQRINGEWLIKQQELLPDEIAAQTARFCNHERRKNADAICVGTNEEDEHGWICHFHQEDQNHYKFSYWYDLYHQRYLQSMTGQKIHSVVHGVSFDRIWITISCDWEENIEVDTLLHVDLSDSGKVHEIDLHSHGLKKMTSFACTTRNEYNVQFRYACGNKCFLKNKEIVCWDQQRLIFLAIIKEQPANCYIQNLPMDVGKEVLKFAGNNDTYPVLGGPLPLLFDDKAKEEIKETSNNTVTQGLAQDKE